MATKIKTELQIVEKRVIRLPTQKRRAAFCRNELRNQGMTIQDLADKSGRHWMTVSRFMDLSEKDPTVNPSTETTRSIFLALGYALCFTRENAKGLVEL